MQTLGGVDCDGGQRTESHTDHAAVAPSQLSPAHANANVPGRGSFADADACLLERNPHDGAQQHLVAIKVKLGLVEILATKDPETAKATIVALKRDADEALETLRQRSRYMSTRTASDAIRKRRRQLCTSAHCKHCRTCRSTRPLQPSRCGCTRNGSTCSSRFGMMDVDSM